LQPLLTFNDVRKYLCIGKDSLLKLLHSGEIKGFKLKGKWRVHIDDLNAYVDRLRGGECK